MSDATYDVIEAPMSAYDFLTGPLTAALLAEPRRIRMGLWCRVRDEDDARDGYVVPYPACGTVGCVGGWTELMVGSRGPDGLSEGERPGRARDARVILGLGYDQEAELFYDEALCGAENQGTAAHAEAVAEHIARFCQRYERQLRAHVVRPWKGEGGGR